MQCPATSAKRQHPQQSHKVPLCLFKRRNWCACVSSHAQCEVRHFLWTMTFPYFFHQSVDHSVGQCPISLWIASPHMTCLLCISLLCLSKLAVLLNVLLQALHWYLLMLCKVFLCSTRDLSHVNLFPQSWHVTTCPLWVSWQMGVLEGVWCSMEHWRVWMSCWNFWSWLISFLGFIECISRSKWLWKELDIITAICPLAKGFTHQGSLNNTTLYIDFMPSLPVLEFDGQWHQPQKS